MLGKLDVEVMYGNQRETLPLIVVKGNGPILFGRDWLAYLKLDWKAIYLLNSSPLQALLLRHKQLFEDGLGTLKGYKAECSAQILQGKTSAVCNERQGGERVKATGGGRNPGAYSVFRVGCTHCPCLEEGPGDCLSMWRY